MRILVTGGAGFVGNALIENLLEKGHEVTSFDRTKHSGLRDGVNEVYGDVTDSYAVDCYTKENDYVFNIAGMLGTQETIDNPIPAIQTNIIGALNVFNAVRRHSVRATHITVGNHWMNNPYSITKSTSERFALMYNKEHGTEITITRGLNIYGPGQKPFPVRKVVPNFILPALRNEDITIYGTGESQMDMIYVTDAAKTLAATMNVHRRYEVVMDIGTGISPTVNEIASESGRGSDRGRVSHQGLAAQRIRLRNRLGLSSRISGLPYGAPWVPPVTECRAHSAVASGHRCPSPGGAGPCLRPS